MKLRLLFFALYFCVGISTVAAQENTLLNKYSAIRVLFEHFHVPVNSIYTTQPLPFYQYCRDIWPANPYYAYVNTACEMQLIQCNKELFFDGEAPIETTAFLKILYTLKWKNTPSLLQDKIIGYTGSIWYFPYVHEALRTNIVHHSVPLHILTREQAFDILKKDTILSFYSPLISSYFDGLEIDAAAITPQKYYQFEKVQNSIAMHTKIIAEKTQEIASLTNEAEQKQFNEKIQILQKNQEEFIKVLEILKQNPLQYDPTIPQNIKDTALQWGITEKVGESVYDFSRSPAYRKFNIKTALNKLQGLVLQPGEEFSFAKYIYDKALRDFKMGWVILKGKEAQAAGGGICGAATTVFEAAYRSGLEISERKEHSQFLLSFYPIEKIGLDAMVYRPRPDLRFINNTGAPILLYVSYPSPYVANFQILGKRHFDILTLEGPNRVGKTTRWVRTIWHKDGSVATDELKSRFSKIY